MKRYNVGDIVVIDKNLNRDTEGRNHYVTSILAHKAGKTAKVAMVDDDYGDTPEQLRYRLFIEGDGFYGWFEPTWFEKIILDNREVRL